MTLFAFAAAFLGAALPEVDHPILAPPEVPPAIARTAPALVRIELEAVEYVAEVAPGKPYRFWSFNGTVPGPMLRVRVGDTVEVSLTNRTGNTMPHNIDLHAVHGPGGGGADTLVMPGETKAFRFKALNPGIYVYHCAPPGMQAMHIANGMYGMILVEPEGGLAHADREFYVMQGDFYLTDQMVGDAYGFDNAAMMDELPDYVLFNGSTTALTGDGALSAEIGDEVRIFFGVGGPDKVSSFHVIGEIFDRVWPEGASEPVTNIQTTLVPAGGATIVMFSPDVPAAYVLVDHSLSRIHKGALGILSVEGPEDHDVYDPVA